MTNTTQAAPATQAAARIDQPATSARARQDAGLSSMLLPELKQVASTLGIKGAGAMRKQQLIDAIAVANGGAPARSSAPDRSTHSGPVEPQVAVTVAEPRSSGRSSLGGQRQGDDRQVRRPSAEQPTQAELIAPEDHPARLTDSAEMADEVGARLAQLSQDPVVQQRRRQRGQRPEGEVRAAQADQSERPAGTRPAQQGSRQDSGRTESRRDDNRREDEDPNTARRSRRRRQRDRQTRRGRGPGGELERLDEAVAHEDDVLLEVAGILDVLESYAFVRTSGYLPGPNDAYVSLSMVRKNDLRKGDVITGAIRQPREGERKEKYNPLVRLDTVNGVEPERMRNRPEFAKLTPLYPQERLRLETASTNMTGRIIDLVSPIGKGQRGLIVSPPKAGKTMVMQHVANAITANNPEVYLMVVLVDERPEEVTDFQRTTTAEVIASTFDRPAEDHTTIAELAVERAKRLVELGRDVVILLDGITRLGRAYNQAAPASGRILSGGVDSAALYPPKRFFGAARNIEGGGSLTILATALVETGSKMDEVIFEEFKGTGNMELKLSRQLADKRIFPAIDVDASGTRREELLLGREELAIVWKLRRVLSGLVDQQALETLLSRMRKTQNNAEFLQLISKTTPSQD